MIEALHIEGFRAFRELEVTGLGRVNLVVGRNAVGKSSLLEAIGVIAHGNDAPARLRRLLSERREVAFDDDGDDLRLDWSRLFHDGPGADGPPSALLRAVGSPQRTLSLSLRHTRWVEVEGEGILDGLYKAAPPVLTVDADDSRSYPVSDPSLGAERQHPSKPWLHVRSLPARGLRAEAGAALFDRLMLTGSLRHVISAIQLIDEGIDRVAFVAPNAGAHPRRREPFIHRPGGSAFEPLHSLGDGAVRLLDVTLTLLDAAGGVMLADEIENGLHYTVQPDLWRLIFRLAAEHDVQVFAVTHSWDCIEAFQQAAAEHPAEGALVRIDRDEAGHYATVYTEDELAIATRQSIEVRG